MQAVLLWSSAQAEASVETDDGESSAVNQEHVVIYLTADFLSWEEATIQTLKIESVVSPGFGR